MATPFRASTPPYFWTKIKFKIMIDPYIVNLRPSAVKVAPQNSTLLTAGGSICKMASKKKMGFSSQATNQINNYN